MDDEMARKIIRKNTCYTDAYFEMMDSGMEDYGADAAWIKYIDECAEDCEA